MANHARNIAWVTFAFALLSFICTSISLLIIRNIGQWNGYLLIISAMACSQLVYDVSFMLRVLPDNQSCVAEHFLWYFAGLSVTFWTNVLILLISYVMFFAQTIDTMRNFKWFFSFATVLPLALSIWSIFFLKDAREDDDNDKSSLQYQQCHYDRSATGNVVLPVYYWIRIISIFINLVGFLHAKYRLSQLGIENFFTPISARSVQQRSTSKDSTVVRSNVAMAVLVGRVKYYPLAQLLCRVGAAWNEYDNYQYSSPESAFLSAILSPSLGICLFGIFLVMQPNAWATLLRLLRCGSSSAEEVENGGAVSEKFSFNGSGLETFDNLPEPILDLIISMHSSTVRITDEEFDGMVASVTSGSSSLHVGDKSWVASNASSHKSAASSSSLSLHIEMNQSSGSYTTQNPITSKKDEEDGDYNNEEDDDVNPGLFM